METELWNLLEKEKIDYDIHDFGSYTETRLKDGYITIYCIEEKEIFLVEDYTSGKLRRYDCKSSKVTIDIIKSSIKAKK